MKEICKNKFSELTYSEIKQYTNMKLSISTTISNDENYNPIVLVSGPPSLCLLSDLIGAIRKFELNGEN